MPFTHPKTVDEFDAAMEKAGDKLVVIDFSATWCGPCQKIKPVFESLASKYNDVTFLSCDVDELSDLDEVEDITGVPTFQFVKKGKKVGEFSGANEDKLVSMVDQLK
ncbi:Thioredoxin [Monocercomonoides exilis]|uniref:Thioredoxin n=1 Tax=Monocercomonoides exilis TaxID=2049356 RepID=UPI003559D0C6|nr:Thioredoxin [Monocercomonoides exilis]KAH7827421.1 Thioredoxin [Monocercomonoides exilis]|eukprot:MONOS_3322.1-p1 / transcript=MONOS_3322.1 / gene=MONOS_3322 / organism=Monocercomonoides_exilis_PA203 / gene_product=Thioredoxin / transcript_product=Thioredoxin / location=Mono_scaffold00077:79086-79472(+) / protein_length=107 / sequence_SO=supercontig / SO=protein_coding / is_pseudo=false